MSYEIKIGERKRGANDEVPDSQSTPLNDKKELRQWYKHSKFLDLDTHFRDNNKKQWVFLSHSNKDFASVRLLRNALEEEDLYPLMLFLKCMDDEDELDSLIKREIESRTNFILCDSNNARSSKWVQKEVRFIESLGRNYERIDVDDFCRDIESSKTTISQFSKRTTIILSFDGDHEGAACKMFSRLMKYDFKLILNPLDDFEARDYYDCTTGPLTELMEIGIVVVIVGDWIYTQSHPFTKDLLAALEKNKTSEQSYLMPIVLEKHISKKITQGPLKGFFEGQCYLCDTVEVSERVNKAVDTVLTRVLTASSMFVYVETFRNKKGDKLDYEEAARLTTLLDKTARMDKAGDLAALGKCYERGWGREKDLEKASDYYFKAQEIVGFPVYDEDISRVGQQIVDSRPPIKLSFWQKFLLSLRLLFWPFD